MLNSYYLYLFSSFIAIFGIIFIFFSLKPNKTNINNKMILKNLLESLDIELPDELKQLDDSSSDPQKFS